MLHLNFLYWKCNSNIAVSPKSSNSMQSTLLLNANLWWHQVDKEGNISSVNSRLEFYLVWWKVGFSFSFQVSIYLCLWPHSQPPRKFGKLFIFSAFILAQPAGCDRAGLPNSSLNIWVQHAQEDLFTPVTYLSNFFLHMHSFPFSSTILYVSALLLSCSLWHWNVQINLVSLFYKQNVPPQ